jgi:putative tryptophan/tyrosine transport system substrate-binding protein
MIDRRKLLFGAAAAALAPQTARAQSARKPFRIGVLETVSPELNAPNMSAFHKGLRELGRVEGKDYMIEYRSAGGVPDKLTRFAAELVQSKVDVILTRGTPAVLAAKNATATIPIVMAASGGPLEAGIVASLARPGGNVTGLSAFTTELSAKRVELAKSLLPQIKRVALVNNMGNPVTAAQWEETKRGAALLGLEAVFLDARDEAGIRRAFEEAVNQKIDVLLFANDGVNHTHRPLILELAARGRVVSIYGSREFPEAGGLLSYGVSYPHLYFRAATFVDKILRGANPAGLPVEQPTKLELVINAKTAAALNLTIPPTLLAFADEVIE